MSKASRNSADHTLRRLESELASLKKKFQMAQELGLEWTPGNGSKSGEVIGTIIRIYESDQNKALDTLRHEFIEHVLTREIIEPYERLINRLISLFGEEIYNRKEKLIERLQELSRCANKGLFPR